jgi:hypothetical protein
MAILWRDIAKRISEIIKVSDLAVYRDKITPKPILYPRA